MYPLLKIAPCWLMLEVNGDLSFSELKLLIASIAETSKFLFAGDQEMLIVAEAWTSSLNNGLLLKTALQKLEGLGNSASARLSKDKNGVLLSSIKTFVSKLAALKQGVPSGLKATLARTELLKVDITRPFLTSPNLAIYDQCLDCKVKDVMGSLTKASSELQDACGGHTGTSWKRDLGAEATYDEVVSHAGRTIKMLDGGALRNALLRYEEVCFIFREMFLEF